MKKFVKNFLPYTLIAMAVLFINLFILRFSFVSGRSMEPTLHDGNCVLLWELAYRPLAGDIVITDSENPIKSHLIKRIIATAGQHVRLSGNQVYVDDILLEEPYLGEIAVYEDMDFIVPDNTCFLMGDNRNHSRDSREIGCLSYEHILGKVLFRLF
ncbi:MAG: signal peptidase I [Lachnospiraceae bacterium]|nr:signal peptidase I [Lachnospiraceae bacterium]